MSLDDYTYCSNLEKITESAGMNSQNTGQRRKVNKGKVLRELKNKLQNHVTRKKLLSAEEIQSMLRKIDENDFVTDTAFTHIQRKLSAILRDFPAFLKQNFKNGQICINDVALNSLREVNAINSNKHAKNHSLVVSLNTSCSMSDINSDILTNKNFRDPAENNTDIISDDEVTILSSLGCNDITIISDDDEYQNNRETNFGAIITTTSQQDQLDNSSSTDIPKQIASKSISSTQNAEEHDRSNGGKTDNCNPGFQGQEILSPTDIFDKSTNTVSPSMGDLINESLYTSLEPLTKLNAQEKHSFEPSISNNITSVSQLITDNNNAKETVISNAKEGHNMVENQSSLFTTITVKDTFENDSGAKEKVQRCEDSLIKQSQCSESVLAMDQESTIVNSAKIPNRSITSFHKTAEQQTSGGIQKYLNCLKNTVEIQKPSVAIISFRGMRAHKSENSRPMGEDSLIARSRCSRGDLEMDKKINDVNRTKIPSEATTPFCNSAKQNTSGDVEKYLDSLKKKIDVQNSSFTTSSFKDIRIQILENSSSSQENPQRCANSLIKGSSCSQSVLVMDAEIHDVNHAEIPNQPTSSFCKPAEQNTRGNIQKYSESLKNNVDVPKALTNFNAQSKRPIENNFNYSFNESAVLSDMHICDTTAGSCQFLDQSLDLNDSIMTQAHESEYSISSKSTTFTNGDMRPAKRYKQSTIKRFLIFTPGKTKTNEKSVCSGKIMTYQAESMETSNSMKKSGKEMERDICVVEPTNENDVSMEICNLVESDKTDMSNETNENRIMNGLHVINNSDTRDDVFLERANKMIASIDAYKLNVLGNITKLAELNCNSPVEDRNVNPPECATFINEEHKKIAWKNIQKYAQIFQNFYDDDDK